MEKVIYQLKGMVQEKKKKNQRGMVKQFLPKKI